MKQEARNRKQEAGRSCLMLLASCLMLLASSVAYANPSKEIDLSHWGFSSPSQIGYAAVGILHKKTGDELVVYDLRKQRPVVKKPATPRSMVPIFKGDYFLVGHFDQGNQNRLGGSIMERLQKLEKAVFNKRAA